MISQKVTIKNPTGLHLRPAGALCKEAINHECKVNFNFKDGTYNAKSILSVLGACVKTNDEIEIVCDGDDEEKAIKAITELVISGLGEEIDNKS